jgi:hypothetical protein
MRWARHVVRTAEEKMACKVLMGKPEGKRQLERLRRKRKGGIRMDLGEIDWEATVDSGGSG